jgi:hypothetical protein
MSGFFVVNYQCAVPADGVHTANKTVEIRPLIFSAAGAKTGTWTHDAYIPEASWFASSHGHHLCWMGSFLHKADPSVRANWGGEWLQSFGLGLLNKDEEAGGFWHYAAPEWFQRWAGDAQEIRPGLTRIDPEAASTAAHWYIGEGVTTPHLSIGYLITYHCITFAVAGDITGSNGGTVTIDLHRASDGELLATTSRVGNGAFSLDWYDNTEDVFVSAYEDDTHLGRSAPALAGT